MDLVAPVLMAGWALGRLLGPQLEVAGGGHRTTQWFGMYYAGQVGKRLPVPLFQALEDFGVFCVLLAVERRLSRWPDGRAPLGVPERDGHRGRHGAVGHRALLGRTPVARRGRPSGLGPRPGGRASRSLPVAWRCSLSRDGAGTAGWPIRPRDPTPDPTVRAGGRATGPRCPTSRPSDRGLPGRHRSGPRDPNRGTRVDPYLLRRRAPHCPGRGARGGGLTRATRRRRDAGRRTTRPSRSRRRAPGRDPPG